MSKLFIKTSGTPLIPLLLSGMVVFIALHSQKATYVWPVGIICIYFILRMYKKAYFYEDHLQIVSPFIFKQSIVEYEKISSVDFRPMIIFNPPTIIIIYKLTNGASKKVGFEFPTKFFDQLKEFLARKNSNMKFTYVEEPYK